MVRDSFGNLYGTALGFTLGGDGSNCASVGCGTIFKLDINNNLMVLHTFSGSDGINPSVMMMDSAGNLLGNTLFGGANRLGTLFKLDTGEHLTVLHSFSAAPTDGAAPSGVLISDTAGNLYGTTAAGGANKGGTVFKLDTAQTLTVLHSFGASTDGQNPLGGLTVDNAGNFYGTTRDGGGSGCASPTTSGCGTIFKLALAAGGGGGGACVISAEQITSTSWNKFNVLRAVFPWYGSMRSLCRRQPYLKRPGRPCCLAESISF
jgi:uncharacterized repeat protein (TIGR03803 family)